MRLSTSTAIIVGLAALLLFASALAGPPLYTITTQVTPGGAGTIQLDPLKDGYQKNNIVTVTAVVADADYSFSHWDGDLAGTANPATLRVNGPATIKAVFVESSGGGGTVVVPRTPALPEHGLVVGYFAQWTIYRRGYLLKHVEESGAAEDLDVINYAFAAIDENLHCVSLDSFADYGKRLDAGESVDGVADTVSQPLKGNFNQLIKLRNRHPHLRVLLSLGGWTQSHRFSDAALPENREEFVKSCIDMFMGQGELAPGVSAAGVFDGFDIDWEYPGSCGETCSFRPEDRENFPALLAEFRRQLELLEDDVQAATSARPEYLLTIAVPAGAANYDPIDIGNVHPHLDWINVMAYDFHGGWESRGPANHHAMLFRSPCDGEGSDWGDKAVHAYITGGVPPGKLLLGVPFYGRGWSGVSAVGDGLCQSARGVPRGTYEKGVDDYEELIGNGHQGFSDRETATHWTFNGSEFWSFDDPESIGWKAGYVGDRALRGVMFWELSGDTPDAELLDALRTNLPRVPAN